MDGALGFCELGARLADFLLQVCIPLYTDLFMNLLFCSPVGQLFCQMCLYLFPDHLVHFLLLQRPGHVG